MIVIDGKKFYTVQEASDLVNITVPSMRLRIKKNPELVTMISGQQHLTVDALNLIMTPVKKGRKKKNDC